jgi:hypothetical protein
VDNGYRFSTRVFKHDLQTPEVSELKIVSCVAMGVGEGEEAKQRVLYLWSK